jgi:polyisoprenoid-binding protein YceI
MKTLGHLLAVALPLLPAVAWPAETSWRIVRGEVHVACPMTVGGSFEAKTPAVSGTITLTTPRPPAFSGGIGVDLRTLETGISLRDDHLRREYLEVDKGSGYDTAVLSDIRLGDVDPTTFQGKTTFRGTFALHGTSRPVSGTAEVRREGATVRVEATFPVTISDYGIPKPTYLGVGVRNEVQVKVSLVAAPEAAAGGPR